MARLHKVWTRIIVSAHATARRLKRMMDVCVASLLLAAASPVALAGWGLGRWRLHRDQRLGLGSAPFDAFTFEPGGTAEPSKIFSTFHMQKWPALWNVVRGELSLVGPRAAGVLGDLSPSQRLVRPRFEVQPGLVCTWWIRQRANIAYGSEPIADREYVETHGPLGDLGILARALWAGTFGSPSALALGGRVRMLGVEIDNMTMDEAVSHICDSEGPDQVCFVNPHCLNIASHDAEYRETLNQSSLVLADGIGMQIGARWLKRPLKQNVNGTDLFPALCREMKSRGLSLFLLGAEPGVADATAAWVRNHYPDLAIAGIRHGFFNPAEESDLIRQIAVSGAAILLVATGVPRQDKWIRANLRHLAPVRAAIGVGGLFDFYSGRIPRAPVWMREAGFEWLYRLYQEPGRMWKRYLIGNAAFLMKVVWDRIGFTRK